VRSVAGWRVSSPIHPILRSILAMLTLCSASVADTRAIAAAVADVVVAGDVIVLAGEMGAGKTAFAQGFGVALGVDDAVTSPTFTLVHRYDGGRLVMHHADVYRLDTLHELDDLGLDDLDGVLLVEWGDVVAANLGDHLLVSLHRGEADDARIVTVAGVGSRWAHRWERLHASLGGWVC
jgi:tRNA threonylcarbamoyladenosine biosynthesis protein TsaE